MAEGFPSILSKLRREKRINQRTAAAALNISQALLSHYENGLREPGLDFIHSACDYYGVSADYLLGRSPLKTRIPKSLQEGDSFFAEFSEVMALAFAELDKGLALSNSEEAREAAASILSVFMYGLLRGYDKSGKFEIPAALSPALCDAAIKARSARLQSLADDIELSFAVPPRLIKMAEAELAAIINDWK